MINGPTKSVNNNKINSQNPFGLFLFLAMFRGSVMSLAVFGGNKTMQWYVMIHYSDHVFNGDVFPATNIFFLLGLSFFSHKTIPLPTTMIRMNRAACLSLLLLLQKLFFGTAFFLQPQRRGPSLALLVAESDDDVVATQENVYTGLSAGKSHQHDNAHGKGQVTNEHPKQSKPWKQLLTRSMTSSLLATSLVLAPFQLEAETPPKHLSTSFLQQQQQHPGLPRLSLNSAWALTEQQLLVDDVWREVTRQFVDRTFQNLGEDGWRQKRLDAVTKAGKLTPDDTDQLYGIIRQMLSYLGDPYTRFLTPEQYESLTNYAKGTNSQAGIGVQLSADPTTGRVIVMNTVPGGPAEKAGILPGDVIYEVDSVDMQGATPEVVGAKCRGEPGSALTMTFQHGGDGKPDGKLLKVDLTRAFVQSRQVQASVVTTDSGKRIGLVQIPSFSFETEKQVREAIDSLANKKVSAVALDLRGNVRRRRLEIGDWI